MKKIFVSFSLVMVLLSFVVMPLNASALGLGDYLQRDDNHQTFLDLLQYYQDQSIEQLKNMYDFVTERLIWNREDFPNWLDMFNNIEGDSYTTGTDYSIGSNLVYSGSGDIFYSNTVSLSTQDMLYVASYINSINPSAGYHFFCNGFYENSAFRQPYYLNFVPSYSSSCRVEQSSNRYYRMYGPYTGAFLSYRLGRNTTGNYTLNGQSYTYRFKLELKNSSDLDIASGSSSQFYDATASYKLFYSTIPIYYSGSDDVFEPDDPGQDSWAHDFVMHSDENNRWSTSHDKYILDLFVYYTGDDSNFEPNNYIASGGLCYIDDSTNTRYLPNADYVFFDSIGSGKITRMSNPGTVFHMHLDKIKDYLNRKRLGFGNWYAFVSISDKDDNLCYYAQQQLTFNDIDDGMFTGTIDYPDWDDYKPEPEEDEEELPSITNNTYNDYTTFESAPNDFDFDAYAQWMYTNLTIMNNNIGTLNDNLLLFFDSFNDFIQGFYPFFERKFNMIADYIEDSTDALARYLKDLKATATFNENVIADNLKDAIKDSMVPDKENTGFILDKFCPWFGQVKDIFDSFDNVGGSSGSGSASVTVSLPAPSDNFSIAWVDYDVDLSSLRNDTLYTALVYILDAAGFFTCVRMGFSIFGLSIFHLDSVAKESEED